jgi:SAM-dependent methyltransferase
MTEVQRNAAYFASQVDATEVERLVATARLRDPHIRDGLRRTGIRPGDKAIDVGCGPLGALLVLADIVGPTGTVVGLDMDAPSLKRARALLDQRGTQGVHLVQANVNTMHREVVCPPGPFDVAVCSQFLNNQPDPAATLRRVAGVVRPGGHLVIQSPVLFDQAPRSQPEVEGLDVMMRWFGEIMRRRGASPDVVRHYHALCQAAGLTEVSQRGFFLAEVDAARTHLRAMHDAVVGVRHQLIELGIASGQDVDQVLQQLHAATMWEFEVYFAAMHVELIAQVPLG